MLTDTVTGGPMVPRRPGAILRDDFMAPLELSAGDLAELAGVSKQHVDELIAGKRAPAIVSRAEHLAPRCRHESIRDAAAHRG